MLSNTFYKTTIISFFCILIFICSKNIFFFWDNTMLVSEMGNYLYNNGLLNFNFPTNIDPGHPPLLAFVHACAWKIFGKSIVVSHIITIPILFGFTWQLHNLVSHFILNKFWRIIAILFVFCDATILAQTLYIGVELPMLFLFLLALNQLLKHQYFFKSIALLFLALCSFRGMLLCAGFFIIECYSHQFQLKKVFTKNNIITYLLAALPAVIYILYRLFYKGSVLQNENNSQWASMWQIVDIKGFLRNIAVLAHRFLDFGRIAIICFLLYVFIKNRKEIIKNSKAKFLVATIFFSTLIIVIVSLFATNSMGHRYFAISYIFMHVLSIFFIVHFVNTKKILLTSLFALILITGNFWKYNMQYSQGWDASLRCISYFNLHNNAVAYLHNNNIAVNKTASFFPNVYSCNALKLNGDTSNFVEYNGTSDYVFFSNIYNLKPKNYINILEKYQPLKRFENCGIWIEILKRKN